MLGRFTFCLLVITAILLWSVPVTAQETHPFSVHDMLAMDRVSGPEVSPDGSWIVFVLRKTDLEANRGRTDLWMVGVDGEGLRRKRCKNGQTVQEKV